MAVETWRGRKFQMMCSKCGGESYSTGRNPQLRWACNRCSGAGIEIAPDAQIRKYLMEERRRLQTRNAAQKDEYGRETLDQIKDQLDRLAQPQKTYEAKFTVMFIAWNLSTIGAIYGGDFFNKAYERAKAKVPNKYHDYLDFELAEVMRIASEPKPWEKK